MALVGAGAALGIVLVVPAVRVACALWRRRVMVLAGVLILGRQALVPLHTGVGASRKRYSCGRRGHFSTWW